VGTRAKLVDMDVLRRGRAAADRVRQRLTNPSASASQPEIVQVKTPEDCAAVFAEPFALLFKKSSVCSLSEEKYDFVCGYYEAHPGSRLYLIVVPLYRAAARLVEEHTGVQHESPQLLAMRQGVVVAHASHFKINEAFLSSLPNS
jgi:bacillithiol system protein YtxJ